MTKYNVHLYRELRLFFRDIEAATPAAAAAIAREGHTSDADDIDECDGQDLAALVDVVGDEGFDRSVTIDFEPERTRKAVQALLDAAELVVFRWEKGDLAEAVRLLSRAIGREVPTALSLPATVLVEVSRGVAEVTAMPPGADAVVVDWDALEAGDADYLQSVLDEVKRSSLIAPEKERLIAALEAFLPDRNGNTTTS